MKAAISQNNSVKVIKGQVLDANGEVLIGATIFEKDTKNGTITDFDGNFTLKSNNVNLILVVSYVGMSTQELKITDKSYYKVILKSKTDLKRILPKDVVDEFFVTPEPGRKLVPLTDKSPALRVQRSAEGVFDGIKIN